MSKTAGIDPYGMDCVALIRRICKAWGLNLTVDGSVKGAKINNGGFPLFCMSSKQACEWLANMCKVG